ncbi:hydroxyacid dehydrogenase [Pseudalkalibacillus sp. A8]|uniref:hydroxyacid dehydrogenase n=1 Tax=Pseudalkalibacillus sp. A8 TaxID=3382641 RepID=UPI0038B61F88
MKVIITEIMWEEGLKELEKQGIEVYYDPYLWKDRKEILDKLDGYDAVIVRNQTKVDQEFLDAGVSLKVVGRLGVGLDNIDIEATKEKDISVVFARHANATSVAEYVLAAILSAVRPLHLANQDIRQGNWKRKEHTGEELFQKTIGLVGLGEIAHRVTKRAQAFGMKIIGFDPFIAKYDHIVSETGVELKHSLHNLLAESDFVSLHVPLTPETKHLISGPELKVMKSNAYLINTSRGGIINEEKLALALNDHLIAGAYLDVLESEPISLTNDLLSYENVVLTPHVAGLTNESQTRTSTLIAKEVGKVLKGEVSLCSV